ncbi:transcriptional regulator [Sphaerisporangium siamense]|uniref:Transcriptional regulator with XRE-family HTH domain n=1 Tax=Sphaerisporangium siamense TaxID=795645 RepID=A0A7W7DA25_9ACTN|nr:Scr1 family TA system antitoxin-like transcriptional regulator [Sphaerisporangium siamense]MBB4703037.1 transcriptional regulator with XRE-family HTH domain [Sphaerisporangium siamense]GII83197.1 transcriptional regulator [Sphaerisporangium siamense]
MPHPSELNPAESPRALFGYELRKHRKAAGLSQEQLSTLIQYTAAMISSVETAKRTPSRDFARRCDDALHLDGTLVRLWPFIHHSATPSWFRPWLDIEREAGTLRAWEPLVIPGLLQTEAYARAIFRGEPRPVLERVEEQVAARLERQSIFERPEPPMFWAVIDEGALRRVIGDPLVMTDQLKRLEALETVPHITLQVLPFSARSTAGLEGSFLMAQAHGLPDAVYVEAVGGHGQVIERAAEVQELLTRYEMIRAEALPQQASFARIREIREHMQLNEEFSTAQWEKSTFSGGSGGNCVEVAFLSRGLVGVRDSKTPAGRPLVFTSEEWADFANGLKSGDFRP